MSIGLQKALDTCCLLIKIDCRLGINRHLSMIGRHDEQGIFDFAVKLFVKELIYQRQEALHLLLKLL